MSKLCKLLFVILAFSSCKNDIDIAAPWKETVVIYGLLDPAAKVNYLRIQKAYLDPKESAYSFTKVNDSIYNADLKIKLFVRQNGNVVDTIFPTLVDGNMEGLKKDSGLFSNAPNYLYKITDPILDSRLSPNPEDYEYELIVTNPKTGFSCGSKTFTTGRLEVLAPASNNSSPINIKDKPNTYVIVGYSEGRKVKAYDMIIRFWYSETSISNPSKSDTLAFDWVLFRNRQTTSMVGYEKKFYSIPGNIFYEILQATILPDKDIKRKGLYCDVEYYGAGEDLYTFIQVNVPSIGIVQKKPEYTNVNNGLGIFSSRYITAVSQVPISAEMNGILKTSEYTKGLNF